LRAVVDLGGQAVTATDRLYLASQVPMLIVWGDRDPFIPVDHAVAAHDAMPGSRLEVFEDVGHFPHCEAPDRFAAVLIDFITSTEPARLSESRWRELLQSPPALGVASAGPIPAPA
jgi:pimeloyl-ACP methyl ester carboxylesterase